jgi:hypothetical protein
VADWRVITRSHVHRGWLAVLVDDAACAALPLATVVTMLYYGLLFANPRFVEEECVHGKALQGTVR